MSHIMKIISRNIVLELMKNAKRRFIDGTVAQIWLLEPLFDMNWNNGTLMLELEALTSKRDNLIQADSNMWR